jgi:phosphoribosylanthranilate isomerase
MADIDVKICGISTANMAAAAADAGAAMLGFVFFEPSPRNVRPRDARSLVKDLPSTVQRVGVFVDPEESLLDRAIAAAGLDIIQLHGSERPGRLAAIKARHRIKIWKAIPVSKSSDLQPARAYHQTADRILFDARTPKAARLPGGMGIAFDWSLLNRFDHKLPWALSGGLTAANVREAISVTSAQLLDVSSGVESAPGVKDATLIKEFMEAVRTA